MAMRAFRALSIRFKLIAIVMITTCTALILVAGALAVFDVVTHRQTLRVELGTVAHILGQNSTAALALDDAAQAHKVLAALASQPEVLSGCLFDARGELFASYVRVGPLAPCPPRPQREVSGFVGDGLVLYQDVRMGHETVGTLRLVASLAQLRRRVQLFGLVLLVVMVGSALGALLLSSSLQRLVSRPIRELASTARQVSERQDYKLRAPPGTEDEVGVAVAAFNQMLQRIEDSDRALRSLNATLEQRVAERTAAAEERAAALRKSNEELERFAYVASHDLKEPLRAISSYAQLVQQRLGEARVGGDLELYVEHVVTGAARMRTLINDLLDYSRVGRQALQLTEVSAEVLLDAVVSDLAATIADSGAQVTRGPLPTVMADRRQLAQLLQNLVNNAIRFRGDSPPRIEVRADLAGDSWRFAVRDNGIGIEPKHHQRIFVLFQRLHGRERPGTGIGLAICKRIVEGHGGSIWVESEPSKGATFFFTLPLRQAPPAPAQVESHQGAGAG
jgi:signal transduction histidine kinase